MISTIITAAGNSSRMGGTKKEYLSLKHGTVLSECAKHFLECKKISDIIVTYNNVTDSEKDAYDAFFADKKTKALVSDTGKKVYFVPGGETRRQSVYNALEFMAQKINTDIVLVHDGARAFVSAKIIDDVITATQKFGAAAPVIASTDTLKQVDSTKITEHLKRACIARVQTPQGFDFQKLLKAHRAAASDGNTYTDDSEIYARYIGDVYIVAGDEANKKITYASDLPEVQNSVSTTAQNETTAQSSESDSFRVGFGYDIHRLVPNRTLVIGGVLFESEKGEDGHSDGDALLHAITDALLGAAALGDIGSFFPPTDDTWKNADSRKLLKTAWNCVTEKGWSLGNIDCVVKIEQPKFNPLREKVRASIADTLSVPYDNIFVKAKTGERLGDVGSGNAIEAWATCILKK